MEVDDQKCQMKPKKICPMCVSDWILRGIIPFMDSQEVGEFWILEGVTKIWEHGV